VRTPTPRQEEREPGIEVLEKGLKGKKRFKGTSWEGVTEGADFRPTTEEKKLTSDQEGTAFQETQRFPEEKPILKRAGGRPSTL